MKRLWLMAGVLVAWIGPVAAAPAVSQMKVGPSNIRSGAIEARHITTNAAKLEALREALGLELGVDVLSPAGDGSLLTNLPFPAPEISINIANETVAGPTSPANLSTILWSTAFGFNALGSPTGSVYGNTAIGDNALQSVTQDINVQGTGSFNTGVGRNAGTLVTTGYSNTLIGDEGAPSLTTGFDNTYVGRSSGLLAVSGNYNTGIGRSALYNNDSGTGNTAVGRGSGLSNTSGSNNTFLGYQAGNGSSPALTNATALGYNAQVTASNAMTLGGTGVNAVKVGIGMTAPAALLDVAAQTTTVVTSAGGVETIAPLSANYTAIRFNTGDNTSIGNVIFKMSRDATISELSFIGLRLYTNNVNKPGTMVTYAQNTNGLAFGTTSLSVGFRMNATVTANTDYWLVFFKAVTSPDTGNFNAYSVAESGGITWGTSASATGTYAMQAGSLAVIIQTSQPAATKITGGPGNTALTVSAPDADAVSITTTSGIGLSVTSTNNTAVNAISTHGPALYAYSANSGGASINAGRGLGLFVGQSGWNATGTIAQPVSSIYRFYNSNTNLTGDLLRINDASTTTGTNSGYLINAGLTPASTFIPKFQVARDGGITTTGKITTSSGLNIPTKTPGSATATGTVGDICWDANYLYVCTAANTWKRAAISTW